MPLLLFWYIFRDLIKVLVISTAVLVTIISFGAAIKPLSDGTLGPISLMRYIVLAIPPMLQFALPFSAAFSATMVYHRMTSDNEIAACAASGVSYNQLLLPPATIGVALTIVLSLISNYISPRFWEAMARTSTRDVATVVISSIEQGEPIRTENTLLYAKRAKRIEVPPGNPADAGIWLDRLLAVNVEGGRIVSTYTARECIFYLQRADHYTIITSVVDDSRLYDLKETGSRTQLRVLDATPPEFVVKDEVDRTPRFMDVGRLNEVYKHPELYDRVAQRINDLRRWMTHRELLRTIDTRLQTASQVRFDWQRLDDSGKLVAATVQLTGGSILEVNPQRWEVQPAPGQDKVRLLVSDAGRPVFSIVSSEVALSPKLRLTNEEPTLEIDIANYEYTDLTSQPLRPRTFDHQRYSGLRIASPIVSDLLSKNARDLVRQARTYESEATLNKLDRAISTEVIRLQRNIVARIHERTAMSVSCLVMMLLGSVLAIYMRSTLPLTVYLWSFLPAILGLVLISAGADVVKDVGAPGRGDLIGLGVMWSGNLIMLVLSFIILRKVQRN